MAHGAHIGNAGHGIASELALHREVPGLRIGSMVFMPETRRAGDGLEKRPVDGFIGILRRSIARREVRREALPLVEARLAVDEGRGEQRRGRVRPVVAIGGITRRIEADRILVSGEENPGAGADTRLSRPSQQLAQPAFLGFGRPGDAETRGEICVAGIAHAGGNSRIARHHPSLGGARKYQRLLARNKSLQLVLRLVPRLRHVPAQAVVKGESGTHAPAILGVDTQVMQARVSGQLRTLGIAAGRPYQIVHPVASRLKAVAETKTAIPAVETFVIDLIIVGGDTKLHGVRTPDPGEIVGQLVVAVIVSADRLRRDPEGEVGQASGRDSLPLRILYRDAGRVDASHKTERAQGDSLAGPGVERHVDIAHVAEPEFVDFVRSEGFGISEGHQLRASLSAAGEALEGAGTYGMVVLNEIIPGEHAETIRV